MAGKSGIRRRSEPQKDPFAIRPMYLYLAPKYWGTWFGLTLLRLTVLFPYPAQCAIGRAAGRLMLKALPTRRRIAARNIELCFPELSDEERSDLVRAHFEALGMSAIEMGIGWWASDRKIDRLMSVDGLEHLETALEKGKGAILITAHFTSVEASGRLFGRLAPPFMAMYRTNSNPFFDEILRRGRLKSAKGVIAKDDVRTMLRTLKSNTPVLYAPDQSYKQKLSALVPFFGVPSMTNTATSTIAKMTGAPVLPYLPFRKTDGSGYTVTVLPPIEGIPSDDPAADAARYHAVIEEHIRKDPAQYFWVHKRFKNRPESLPDAYANLSD